MEFSRELKRLYKYRSLAAPFGRETAENIVVHSRMFWQSPTAFNDPFDCAPVLKIHGGREGVTKYARSAARNVRPDLPRKDRRKLASFATKRSIATIMAGIEDSFKRMMAGSAVTCFAEAPDVPLMWAHYADSHRGVCFVFQECLQPTPFFAFDVFYSKDRPIVDVANLRDVSSFQKAILVKDSAWSYEAEHRMFDYRKGPGVRSFPEECLVGVVLGARISPEDEEYVRGLVKQRKSPVPISRAGIHPTRFSIEIN